MGIYNKLFEIQKSTRGLKKDKKGNNYEYVSGTKILTHIRAKMDELGVILKQEVLSIENQRMDYKTGVNTQFEKPKSEILSKVEMRFTWVDVETGEQDQNLFGANGQNDWDKGVGSALTYAERYFLLKYFHIPTDEDDIDALPPKDSPTDEDDKSKLKPLSDKAFNAALARINKGEKLVENIKKEFSTTADQLTVLVSAENNYKPKT
ncbi:ERF family protein [Sphingobacterium sp. InxBP1]|uniref:ERF family protein n=1 Tax=Sphingobacterium sp. InxBP1 TaxID=2870328 RepID=UPI0022442AB8|nr:ERF family protein [Sphingobacterium sp. InxBP1]MCW8311446.1 ERF family protein [Sphingobacterium sp. InxBP1]